MQSGLIGGILSETGFQMAFGLDKVESASALASLKGNIVSVLQAGKSTRNLFAIFVRSIGVGDGMKNAGRGWLRFREPGTRLITRLVRQDVSSAPLRPYISRTALVGGTLCSLQPVSSLSVPLFRYAVCFPCFIHHNSLTAPSPQPFSGINLKRGGSTSCMLDGLLEVSASA